PPVSSLAIVLDKVVGYPDVARLPGFGHADLAPVVELLERCGDCMANVVAPTKQPGDVEGARRQPDGSVKTPAWFKPAYRHYVDAGWGSVPFPE
ncbi:hypothetical protein, partial [Lacisediminihabitans profunda]|uniref:hypothetical protein n=1 Tax=Lacisediminihabitans profunda TaxID=2594790 RepID=UPI003CCC4FDC